MRKIIMGLAVTLGTTAAHAISQQEFAALALKAGGAIVGECPSTILTRKEILASGIEQGVYAVTTQSSVNGSNPKGFVVNPIIRPAKRGCIYKAQKIESSPSSGKLTIKNQ